MTQYIILGKGEQFSKGFSQTAESATEALSKYDAVKKLCGSASATDSKGKAVSRTALGQLAKGERRAERSELMQKDTAGISK